MGDAGGTTRRVLPRPADAPGPADRDLVAPGAVDARAEPGPLRRHVHARDRLRGHLGDASPTPSWSSRSSPATRGSSTPARATRSCARSSATTRSCVLDEKPAHQPAPAAAAALPRRADAGLRRDDDARSPPARSTAGRPASPYKLRPRMQAITLRDHPRDRLRRRTTASATGRAARGAARLPRPAPPTRGCCCRCC